jgi:hypothetical protein
MELSCLSLFMRGPYTALLDIYHFHSLYLYHIPCMLRQVNLVPWRRSSILHVCSSAMYVNPENRGSAFTGVGMGPRLVICC